MAAYRDVRRNMRRVDDVTAAQLISTHTPYIRKVAAKAFGDFDDFVQVGAIADIEAHLSWAPGAGANRNTWTRKVVRWRIAEAAENAYDEAQPDEDIARYPNGLDPEEAYAAAHVRDAIGKLSHRQRNVLDARLRGHTFREIGAMVGVSPQQAQQDEQIGLARLRDWANKDVDWET